MTRDWLVRWEQGNTGWHEPSGNAHLRRWWRASKEHRRVLVPLCGKARDLLWLAEQGHQVTGVELSPLAIEAFFAENEIAFQRESSGGMQRYFASDRPLEVFCGDYFEFEAQPFDAVFDRGALVALGAQLRPAYVEHTRALTRPGAQQLLVTLSYDQALVDGPPFSVPPAEVTGYWPNLETAATDNAIDSCPPKFRAAGLATVTETVWRTAPAP